MKSMNVDDHIRLPNIVRYVVDSHENQVFKMDARIAKAPFCGPGGFVSIFLSEWDPGQ